MASNWSDWIYDLQEKTNEELDRIFMDKAHKEKNTEFEYIDSLQEYFLIKSYQKALKQIVKNYNLHKDSLYHTYCKLVESYENDDKSLTALLTVKACEKCINYYIIEIETISNMLEEYRYYIYSGHFLEQIWRNDYRPKENFWDHRYKKLESEENQNE